VEKGKELNFGLSAYPAAFFGTLLTETGTFFE
jgi:hypothetical protein